MSWFVKKREKRARLEKYLKPKWSRWAVTGGGPDQAPRADVTLDFELLAKKGFITPDNLSENLARDYNLVKRRLFQRLDFFTPGMSAGDSGRGHRVEKTRPVILITSGSPAEGKTFSCSNLALSLALEERIKVLLIDADLAKPSIPEVFGYDENRPGLFEYLSNPERPISDYILTVAPLPIRILPAGQATSSPAQMLKSEVMTDLIDSLTMETRSYDIILLDGPPLLATTEASALAPLADEVIVVVGTGDATLEEIGSSLDFLGGTDHVSMIMNKVYFPEKAKAIYPYGETAR